MEVDLAWHDQDPIPVEIALQLSDAGGFRRLTELPGEASLPERSLGPAERVMPATVNRQILLKSRPSGAPSAENFELVERPIPQPGEGEVLMRSLYLSLDPYMRGRMSD